MLEEFKKRHGVRKRYLVGVSGGRDSVALVDLLQEAGYGNLVLCHLNHCLRGRSSGQDASFVRRLGAGRRLPVEVERVDVKALAKLAKISLETAARQARLTFFAGLAGKHRCPRVLLGHHADDQVETVIMRLFRGAGPEGLEGMREVVRQRVVLESGMGAPRSGRRIELIRPLLGWWRRDIDAYVAERGLPFREDRDNSERSFLRNRVRHELIPELERLFGRDVRMAVWRLSELSAGENAFFREILEGLDYESRELAVGRLRSESVAVQRRWVRAWLQARGIRDLSFRDVEAVRLLAAPAAMRAKVNLPGAKFARRREKKLFLE